MKDPTRRCKFERKYRRFLLTGLLHMKLKTGPSDLVQRFQSLISRHTELRSKETARLQTVVARLLPGFREARKVWADSQRHTAEDFNLFEIMGVASDEVRHSKILAWLLDHRIERGTHAQGNLGFRLFLEEFAGELRLENDSRLTSYADEPNYWVHAEVSGDESRVDAEVAARGKFLIHLENKIYATEGEDQTNREWRDLQTRRRELGVPEDACHAIFLTLDGTKAENENFHSLRWSRIAIILDRFAESAEPLDVKLFARHYAKAIRKMSVMEREEIEADDAEVQ